ncbi:glycosyltransferase family 39 protein [Haloparvum alkalitolerans]|uniref:ArnT family glycosyltransferase n=1 Tax=Haloparvum alkalitolerans TaxID=1042953 RepID=UPI003CE7A03A
MVDRTTLARTATCARTRLREDPATRVRVAAALVVLAAGVVTFLTATGLFPYHSSNHDEAVYLQQAGLLLDGQLQLFAGEIAGAVHPWFFVQDGGRLYPKYSPVPSAMYAVSIALFDEPRVTLAAVSAGNAACIYALASAGFDRRVGVVAAAVFAAAPMALLTGSVFLPYAPTTFLNLLFAVAYVRATRRESRVYATFAGVAVGLAFFARPFTAVLFAAPFIAHALWTVASAARTAGAWPPGEAVVRQLHTAALGLLFVGVTLAYNAHLTGDPLTFPYQAFAPLDGPGFGYREILGHSETYTPALALETNAYGLWYLISRWFTAGLLGTAAAVAGLAVAVRRWSAGAVPARERLPGVLVAGLLATVPVGNLFFWGTHNLLADATDPTDGIVAQFGPFYHFDLLVPLSIFAAVGAVTGWRRARGLLAEYGGPERATAVRALLVALALSGVLVAGAANAAVLDGPVERNAAYTEKHDRAYEPVEATDFEDSLVLLPTPYGDWLNHPFQYLRNDGTLDGDAVYALDRDPESDFAVLDAFPNRTSYRYAYQGQWTGDPNQHVTPKLERLDVRSGERLDAETTVGVPAGVERATVRLENEAGDYVSAPVDAGRVEPGGNLTVAWSVDEATVRLTGPTAGPGAGTTAGGDGNATDAAVPVAETDELLVLVRLTGFDGSTLTYRQEVTVRTDGDRVEVVWPPERSVCPLVDACDNRGTYLPDHPEEHPSGVSFETNVSATAGDSER